MEKHRSSSVIRNGTAFDSAGPADESRFLSIWCQGDVGLPDASAILCRQLPGARHGLLTSWRAASAELLPQETVLRSSSRLAVICSPDFSRSGESKSSPRAADPLHGTSISVSVTGTGSEQHTLHPVRADTIGVAGDKGVARYRRYTSASRSHFVAASTRSRGRLDAMEQSTRYGV
jgi:hypothetical protein